MCSRDIYSVLFFIYGLAFFSLGISAIQQRKLKDTDIPLLKSVKILGVFGVIHGLSEWILMFIMMDKGNKFAINLLFIANFLNSLSFTLLWIFGTKLFKNKRYRINIINAMPFLVIGIWMLFYIICIIFAKDKYLQYIHIFKITSKYLIGLPAGMTVCIGLYKNAKIMKKLKGNKIYIKFNILAIAIGIYSLLAGLIISNVDLFPVKVINLQTFGCKYGFPLELSRMVVAIIIAILFINVIDIFMWEAEYKIERLTQQKLQWQERRKVGYELHDRVIQDLFASGLALESILENKDGVERETLTCIKLTLNNVIAEIRGFINKSSLEKLNIADFKIKIIDLVEKMDRLSELDINLDYEVSEVTLGSLSSNTLEQIYYIIQETISNSIKHSKGNKVNVYLQSTLGEMVITIKDNGTGLDYNNIGKEGQYGLLSIKQRATSINASIEIDSTTNGVVVRLIVPWEEIDIYE